MTLDALAIVHLVEQLTEMGSLQVSCDMTSTFSCLAINTFRLARHVIVNTTATASNSFSILFVIAPSKFCKFQRKVKFWQK